MRSYSFEGFVIKRSNVGEADKLITFYTKDLGKLTLKARGIRKINSKRAGSLELFNQVKAAAVVGKGNLDTLTEVQALQIYPNWRKHLGRVNLAYQLCEVVDKLLPEKQSHPKVYEILTYSFSQISNLNSNWQSQMHTWLVEILVDLGYWPEGQPLAGDIHKLIESIIQKPINSPKLLRKLRP